MSMFSAIVTKGVQHSFSLSFAFFRFFVPFKSDETYKQKLIECTALAAVSAVTSYHSFYSYSHLPSVLSASYNNDVFDSKSEPLSLIGATAITALSAGAIYANKTMDLIPSALTYAVLNINKNQIESIISKKYFVPISVIVGAADYATNNFLNLNKHYFTFSTAGAIISYSFFNSIKNPVSPKLNSVVTDLVTTTINPSEDSFVLGMIIESIKRISSTIIIKLSPTVLPTGIALGLITANYEDTIIDRMFAPSQFNNSYNTLTKYIEPKVLNLVLQKHFIELANWQVGIGFYGNYLLTKGQEKTNIFSSLTQNDHKLFDKFIQVSAAYFLISTAYTLTRTTTEIVSSIISHDLSKFLKQEFLNQYLLNKDNFIQSTKTNLSTSAYLEDFDTIASSSSAIISWQLFGIAKLSNLGHLTAKSYIGLGMTSLVDYPVNYLLQYFTNQKQEYTKQSKVYESQFEKVNEYDKEFAATILQKKGLNYTIDKWDYILDSYWGNSTSAVKVDTAYQFVKGFYDQDVLYSLLHIVVADLVTEGQINPDELFLLTRTLQVSTDFVMFKSKNDATFSKIGSSLKNLEELYSFLQSNPNTIKNIETIVDETQNSLIIENLNFTRGDDEQASSLYIKNITLNSGNIYAITGANGAGKSSFSTLLQYALERISDSSFSVNSGKITYPAFQINMITQKDYLPSSESLFDLVIYPNKKENLSKEAISVYEQKIVHYINKLQVFKNDVSVKDLYELEDSWKDLSGGQKKKLFLIDQFITCPKILIMDEIFGPLDVSARQFVMEEIKNSCLNTSLTLVVWHQDQNHDNTTCVKNTFFDYELHLSNETAHIGKVGQDCIIDL